MQFLSSIIDTHAHIFDPDRFGYGAGRSYTPGPATVREMVSFMQKTTVERIVLVQASPYGTDNRAMLAALRTLGPNRARGVAVVDPARMTDGGIAHLRAAGVRAIRANLKTAGIDAPEVCIAQVRALDARLKGTDMMLQIFVPAPLAVALLPTVAALGRPVIFDHFAGLKTGHPNLARHLDGLADLLSLPNVILKASGACRVCDYAPDLAGIAAVAPGLLSLARGRVIWGSDWPHTGRAAARAQRPVEEVEPFEEIDDIAGLDHLRRWAGSDETFEWIVRDTPAALFGF